MQRVFDLIAAGIGLVILSPMLAVIAVLVKINDGGPVLYRGLRIGKGERPFHVLKFRSMVQNAEKSGAGITASGDSRITAVGKILRRFKLDELPQLINVLKGDMSIVGPRPEDPRYVQFYTGSQRRLLMIRPGITSPASLHYRNEEALLCGMDWEQKYVSEILPHKLAMDLRYFEQQNSVLNNVMVVVQTLRGILR